MADLTLTYNVAKYAAMQVEVLSPPNRTQLEADLITVQQRITDLQIPLKAIMDPDTCPEDLLPWLASCWGVDIWFNTWPDTTKRNVIRNIVALKRSKGKPTGIRNYVALTGATIVSMVRPPATAYRIPSYTPAQLQSYYASLPQIRIFKYHGPGTTVGYRFHATDGFSFRGMGFRRPSLGSSILAERAVLHLNNTDYPCTLLKTGSAIYNLGITQPNTNRSYRGVGFHNNKFLQSSIAAQYTVNLQIADNAAAQAVLGYQPTTVTPKLTSEIHTAPKQQKFRCSSFFKSVGFRCTTDAYNWIYYQIPLYDPKYAPPGLTNVFYRGHITFGIEAFTTKLKMQVPLVRSLAKGFGGFRVGYRVPTNVDPLYQSLRAVNVSKSFRDRALVDINVHHVVTLADGLFLGNFTLGQIIQG